MILGLEPWVFWLILMAVLLLIEVLTVNLVSIWFAGGALAAMIASFLGASVLLQIIIAVAISGVLLAAVLTGERPELDMQRVVLMCLIHDLGEAFDGDVPAIAQTAPGVKAASELAAMERARQLRRGRLSPAAVQSLYGTRMGMSASRMDRVRQCHFGYFMQYGLRARERRPAGFEAPEIGTFLHYLLENTAREVAGSGGWAAVKTPQLHAMVRKYIDLYIRDEIPGYEEKSARFRYLFGRLRTTAEDIVDRMAEELAESDFKPVAFELGFGGRDGALPAITIQEGDATLSVSGKVDRVDGWLHDGKLYLRVVDYKTGRKSFDLSDVRYGLGIQMLLYLFTLEKEGQSCFGYPIVPAGVLYHPARDLILKTERDISPEPLRKAMDRELRRDGMVLGDPEVLRAMEHSALEAPCFLPIQVSKDGGISGGVATAAQLGRLGQYVEKLLHQITRELRQGNIDADPCWRGPQESACTYCDFASACHFQDGQADDRLRPLKRVKPDEFWEFVAHETGEEGRHGEL